MKKMTALLLASVLFLMLACTISYEGINWGIDEEIEKIESLTQTASAPGYEPMTSGEDTIPANQVNVPEEPADGAAPLASPPEVKMTGNEIEYTVSATDNGCICSTSGNMMVSMEVEGDKLIYSPSGGTSEEYQKIDVNTFKRTFMGYYILVDRSSGQEIETRVDEERHVVIILTETGFIMEHYQGNESSPCCYYTCTKIK